MPETLRLFQQPARVYRGGRDLGFIALGNTTLDAARVRSIEANQTSRRQRVPDGRSGAGDATLEPKMPRRPVSGSAPCLEKPCTLDKLMGCLKGLRAAPGRKDHDRLLRFAGDSRSVPVAIVAGGFR